MEPSITLVRPPAEDAAPRVTALVVAVAPPTVALWLRALQNGGLTLAPEHVTSLAPLRQALLAQAWQVVLVAYGHYELSAESILDDVQRLAPGVPVIIVVTPGALCDPASARLLLRRGARDVVQAGHLDRLPVALERALLDTRSAARPTEVAREREAEQAALATFAAALRSTTTRAAMLPIILEQVQTLLQVDGVALLHQESSNGQLTVEATLNWLNPASARPTPAPDEPVEAASTRPIGMSAANAPLVALGQTIGLLSVNARRTISPPQARLLNALTDMAASALHRAALHEQTERRLLRLAALHAVDVAITTSFDLRVTLSIMLDHLVSQLQVDAAAVVLLSPPVPALEYAAVRGLNLGLLRQARTTTLPAAQVVAQRAPLHLPNLEAARSNWPTALAGFSSYYGLPLIAKGRLHGVLEVLTRRPLAPNQEWLEFLESLATQSAIAIDSATLFADLQRTNLELSLAYDATIEGWARVLEARGIESPGHSRRVADLTMQLARQAGLNDSELVQVRRGALLHDIGMLAVAESVVLRPGPLNEADQADVRRHPTLGFEMLAPINHLRPALDIPHAHHERWDGSGYPRGLRGEHIPLPARLFAVVDVWDALCSDRPYRRAWTEARARNYLHDNAGTQFDPRVVNLFLQSNPTHAVI